MRPILIAELSSNPAAHGWNLEECCRQAHFAGADAVKVQLFRADHFPKEERAGKRAAEFPRHRWANFVSAAHAWSLKAGASVFDDDAVKLARSGDFVKLAAREQHDYPLLDAALHAERPIYRSVTAPRYWVRPDLMCTLLAVPEYPTPMARALWTLVKWNGYFRRGLGWSSHTRGWLDCWFAAALGASVVEKHLCLSRRDPEAGHSLLPEQFYEMARRLR